MFVPKFSDISFMLTIKAFCESGNVPWLRYYKVWEGEVYLTSPSNVVMAYYPSKLALFLPPRFFSLLFRSPHQQLSLYPPHSAVSPSLSRLFSFCFVVSLSLLFLPSVLLLFFSCYFSTLFILLCLCPQLFLLSLSVYISELNPSLVVTKPLKSCIANVLNPNAYPTFFLQLRLVIPLRRVCLNSPLSMII